jgi:hypothetical protein
MGRRADSAISRGVPPSPFDGHIFRGIEGGAHQGDRAVRVTFESDGNRADVSLRPRRRQG